MAKLVRLTDYEKKVLDGSEGQLKQVCMENIVRYAEVLGAEELCEVTKATVFCGAHNYQKVYPSDDFQEVFSGMQLAADRVIPFTETYNNCYVQSCVAPCDQYAFTPFGQSEEFFNKNSAFIEGARKAGVTIAGTCAPYLTGWIPVKGEHFVTTESGVTMIGNSLWGAMGNSDGIEAAFWSAVCGRTPKWGKHLEEDRGGTHIIKVEARIEGLTEWDLLGKAVGKVLESGGVPVIDGDFKGADFQAFRRLCTTLAVSSNSEMCHIVGYSPEARTVEDALKGGTGVPESVVREKDLKEAYESICDEGTGDIDFVSLGCPHFDIDQIKRTAYYVEGKKIHPRVHFMLWTPYPLKCMAAENGYEKAIEEAGGHIYTSSCPSGIGDVFLKNYTAFVFDSLKMAGAVKSEVDAPVYYGDVERCIDAAVSGRWEEEHRWR